MVMASSHSGQLSSPSQFSLLLLLRPIAMRKITFFNRDFLLPKNELEQQLLTKGIVCEFV